jgi:hypothetical protein
LIYAIAALSAFLACPGSARAQDRTFGGYDWTEDCSGHAAGYRWAEEHDITDPSHCGGNSQSFEVYTEDPGRNADEDDDGKSIDE